MDAAEFKQQKDGFLQTEWDNLESPEAPDHDTTHNHWAAVTSSSLGK